jgi:hypothetical protein
MVARSEARMEKKNAYKILDTIVEKKNHTGNLIIEGFRIMKCVLKK